MIIVIASIAAILTVPLTGRSLAPLARLDLRRVWLVWLSISLQLLITVVPGSPTGSANPCTSSRSRSPRRFLEQSSSARCVHRRRSAPALNLAAIAANNGTMPASPWAWHTAGYPVLVDRFENSNVVAGARLWWLGDVFAIPKGWPFANVFSVGDVIIVIAIAYFAHSWCRRSAAPVDGEPRLRC